MPVKIIEGFLAEKCTGQLDGGTIHQLLQRDLYKTGDVNIFPAIR